MSAPTQIASGPSRAMSWIRSRYSRGVGLIDVLIAMLVLAGGVAGLAKMQAVVLKESDSSKARSVAVQLATAKLDDLRSFTQADAGTGGVFGYDEIADNAGGAEFVDGSLRLPTGNVSVGNVSFMRTWTAEGRYFCAFNTVATAANCSGAAAKVRPDFYAITVTVTWTDADGAAQTVALNGSANSTDPLLAAFSLLSLASEGPIVTYVPGQAPQVIAINTGGGRKIETTNPTPSVTKHAGTVVNTIARYETVSYDAANQTLRRRQFTTVNCVCEQAPASQDQGEDRNGNVVTKRTGIPANQFQAFECTICCRDHHDRAAECNPSTETGRKGCYDPYRDTSDYLVGSGDHKHFTAGLLEADDPGDVYVEACRMERIDGYLRVVPDWKLAVVNTIPENYFTSSSANVTTYGDYVKDFVRSVLSGSTAPTKPWSENESLAKNATQQFLARAIYVDYLTSAEKAAFVTRIAANDPQAFQEIPFYEVNMTKLAQWYSGAPGVATVTNAPLVAESPGQNLYSRGLATGVSAGTANITARVRLGNTGIINEFVATDPLELQEIQTPFVVVTVPGTTYAVTGTISGIAAGTVVSVAAIGTGSSPNSTCTYVSGTFSCTLPQGWNGNLSPSASGYSFSPGMIAIANLSANLGSQTFVAAAAQTTYTVSGLIAASVADAVVNAVGTTPNSNVSCTTSGGSSYSCVLPAGWSGTILPTSATDSFAPGGYNVTGISGNQTLDFTSAPIVAGQPYSISGIITNRPQQLAGSFAMIPSGGTGANCAAITPDGSYSCSVPIGWTGSLTPTVDTTVDPGISFAPDARNFPFAVSGNLSNQDFATYYRISGLVAYSDGNPVPGVTFTATGNAGSPDGTCSYVEATGLYSCVVLGGWNGTISPSANGVTFSPDSVTYTNLTGPSDQPYPAAPNPTQIYTVTVTVTSLKAGNGANDQTAVSIPTNPALNCGQTVLTGTDPEVTATITCTAQSGSSFSVSPNVPNIKTTGGGAESLKPSSISFSNLGANQTASFTVTSPP